jgi:hypothetical protein
MSGCQELGSNSLQSLSNIIENGAYVATSMSPRPQFGRHETPRDADRKPVRFSRLWQFKSLTYSILKADLNLRWKPCLQVGEEM